LIAVPSWRWPEAHSRTGRRGRQFEYQWLHGASQLQVIERQCVRSRIRFVGQILFVAFAGRDVAGAKWFGFPAFWMNRLAGSAEELKTTADP
jgi:hypothetical protein